MVEAKYKRYRAHTLKCMGCAADDSQRREYEQSAVKDAQGNLLLDRDGIHFPVVEV